MTDATGATVERRAGGGDLCGTVVAAVAAARDVDPTALEPLYDAVDPEALDELFVDGSTIDCRVTFAWAGCEVTVRGDRSVVVHQRSDADPDQPQ